MTNIITKIRQILNETAQDGFDIFTFETSRVFNLTESLIITVDTVIVNDIEVAESGNWSYNATTNKLTFEDDYTFTASSSIEIYYSYYSNYSDTEIRNYIKSAIYSLTTYGYKTFVLTGSGSNTVNPEPTQEEENLIALIASILMRPNNTNIRMPDLSISQAGKVLNTEEKISRAVAAFKKTQSTHGLFYIA